MNKAKGKTKAEKIIPLIAAGMLSVLPAKAENLFSVGSSQYHDSSYGSIGAQYIPLFNEEKIFIQGQADLGDETNGNLSMAYRTDPKGYEGFGVNGSYHQVKEHNYGSLGLEALTEKSQIFANGYISDELSGFDAGVLLDLVSKDRFSLRGLLGGYSFKSDCKDSSGVRFGLRGSARISRNLALVAQGDYFTDNKFTGDYSASVGIIFGDQGNKIQKPIEKLNLIPYVCGEISSVETDTSSDSRPESGTIDDGGNGDDNDSDDEIDFGFGGPTGNGPGNGDDNDSDDEIDFGFGGPTGNN